MAARIACLGDDLVTKSAPLEYLRGELHFYRSIPPELTHLFPTLVAASEDASQELPSMTITKASDRDYQMMHARTSSFPLFEREEGIVAREQGIIQC